MSDLIDFDGVAMAPRDLDAYKLVERVSYLATAHGVHRHAARYLVQYLQPQLELPGGPERWMGYPLARTLWYGTLIRGTKDEQQKARMFLGEQLRMIAEGTAVQHAPVRKYDRRMQRTRRAPCPDIQVACS